MRLEPFVTKFESISTAATKEYSLDRALTKMIAEWQDIEFSTSTYRSVAAGTRRRLGFPGRDGDGWVGRGEGVLGDVESSSSSSSSSSCISENIQRVGFQLSTSYKVHNIK